MAKRGNKGKKRGGVPRTDLGKRLAHTATGGPVAEINDGNFDRVVASSTPTLIDFWAPWCGPCKAMAPILEQLALDRRGSLNVAKYNTEANNHVASQLKIRSIPTLALYLEGELLELKVGAMRRPQLESWLDGALSRAA